jgi:hypothetical protein
MDKIQWGIVAPAGNLEPKIGSFTLGIKKIPPYECFQSVGIFRIQKRTGKVGSD